MPVQMSDVDDRTWNEDRLRSAIADWYPGESIIILANRQPYTRSLTTGGEVLVRRSTGGLVTGLEPMLRACSGTWVAQGTRSADGLMDERDPVPALPAKGECRVRGVCLTEAEQRGYYYGFANEGLWPLCHRAHVQPVFRSADFEAYESVNERFADVVCNEARSDSPLVLVQDYHFALAPELIRDRLPQSTIVAFWHIPWPTWQEFERCPMARRLVRGLLGSTIVGFQTATDCQNFAETADSLLPEISRTKSQIVTGGRRVSIRAYPVSIAWPNPTLRDVPPVDVCRSEIRRQLGLSADVRLGLGVDRLDFTKGIAEKFLALERLLETRPALCDEFVFVQIAEPSRQALHAYRDVRQRVVQTAERVNRRFGTSTWRPIVLLEAHHDPVDVCRFMRAADVCFVASLHDGMNLVAKEFVSARDDERGVLVLSRFAGASRELGAAIIVNPYAVDECGAALARALDMAEDEQRARLRELRRVVSRNNAYRWAGQMLSDAAQLREPVSSAVERPTVGGGVSSAVA